MESEKKFSSIQALVRQVIKDYSSWKNSSPPWFRGEPRVIKTPLLPRVFREENNRRHDELKLLQFFRMKSPSLGFPYIPPRESTDQWLFLAQHVGLPTRLLDWTGGLLIALHFALYTKEPGAVVWMLNPDELNRKSVSNFNDGDYTLTWFSQRNRQLQAKDLEDIKEIVKSKGDYLPQYVLKENIASAYINNAWTRQNTAKIFPFALYPTNIHPRMSSQVSRFTIHGTSEKPMPDMGLDDRILKKYVIADRAISKLKKELRLMGVSHSSLFPDLDGLSDELSEIY